MQKKFKFMTLWSLSYKSMTVHNDPLFIRAKKSQNFIVSGSGTNAVYDVSIVSFVVL